MFYKTDHILNDLRDHIKNKKPFSIVRLGDGDLKMIKIMLRGDYAARKFRQQGIPNTKEAFDELLKIYRRSCNNANYISNFDVYFNKKILWKRNVKPKTLAKMEDWRKVYRDIGVNNTNYCSPEIGVYLFLNRRTNLFNLMKGSKVCLITCFPNVESKMRRLGYNVDTFLIPGRNGNHQKHYNKKIIKLKRIIGKYDFFIVGAGAYGRGYSLCIKRNGGIAVDVGQVFDVWNTRKLPDRLRGLVRYDAKNMIFILTDRGKMYRGAI